jgi:hypothetical protein
MRQKMYKFHGVTLYEGRVGWGEVRNHFRFCKLEKISFTKILF